MPTSPVTAATLGSRKGVRIQLTPSGSKTVSESTIKTNCALLPSHIAQSVSSWPSIVTVDGRAP
jgi:hypothetical protein